jgi:lipoprotein-releasing system permease protein
MPYEIFIGLRYLKAKRKQFFMSINSIISIAGVFLGVMTLIIVLAVMNGFETDMGRGHFQLFRLDRTGERV